jgi:hypothetical protein
VSCSLHKAAKQVARDVETGEEVGLFNPRLERWTDHFQWQDCTVVGKTATGRATVAALRMNRPLIVAIRREEMARGRHPHV